MEKVIGYKEIIKDGKILYRPIYQGLGSCPLPTSYKETTRKQGELDYIVKKLGTMSSNNGRKYTDGIRRSQKEKFGPRGKELARKRGTTTTNC